jgi:hypothetical protein
MFLKTGFNSQPKCSQNLPTKWFINPHDKSGIAKDKPSEYVLKKVFAMFGDIRTIDIPMLDPYRCRSSQNLRIANVPNVVVNIPHLLFSHAICLVLSTVNT